MGHVHAVTLEKRHRIRQARDAIDSLITAEAFDAAAVNTLACRRSYADAASCLLEIINRPAHDLIPILIETPTFVHHRFAVALGAVPARNNFARPFNAEDLRVLGTREARLAMIASGEPMDWEAADRVERAVYALRHIVLRMCAR